MKIDGRAIAADIYSELAGFFKARKAKLGIIVAGHDPVIEQFVRIKTRAAEQLGIEMVRIDLPDSATTTDVIEAVQELQKRVDGLIVQLPLPGAVDVNGVLASIAPQKDVDAISPAVPDAERLALAPVALAVLEILERSSIEPRGKRAVVVGAGRLVGAPTASLLKSRGAEVSMFTLREGSIEDLRDADIIVSGAGRPGLIKPEHVKKGVALIDAGASEQGKKVVGDADPACAEVAAVFTPVPGGVGPVAVAMIFKNLKALIEKAG